MPKLLVIDDETLILRAFQRAFIPPEFAVVTAATLAEGLAAAERERPDVIISDIRLPDGSGLRALAEFRRMDARVPVILMTGHGTADTAIEAMKNGAYDYLLKPPDLIQAKELIARAAELSRLMRTEVVADPAAASPAEPRSEAAGTESMIGRSRALQEVFKSIGQVAGQDVPVLITGESGTGKELVARAIYQHSRRAAAPMMAINCAALPEQLLESELFGHEKGAFTGADRRRIGKFEQCAGGTLFLDEIGELSPAAQAKLLRVLQDQTFQPLGGNATLTADVRIIAATNRDLESPESVAGFRRDLFWRLGVFTIHLPPLRDRPDDLPLLIDHFVRRFSGDLQKDVRLVAPEAGELLQRYSWPGNVRELQSAIKQAILRSSGSVLMADFLPMAVRRGAELPAGAPAPASAGAAGESALGMPDGSLPDLRRLIRARLAAGGTELHAEFRDLVEKLLLAEALRHTGGNLSETARLLGIHRATIRSRVAALGLSANWSAEIQDGGSAPSGSAGR